MAVTTFWYGKAFLSILNKEVDWMADDIGVSLHTSLYVPNQDTHDYYNDVNNEVGDSGDYAAGGQLLTVKTIDYTGGTNVIKLSAAPTVWTGATITARYVVIYDATPGVAATDPLLGYVDFGGNVSCTNGTFTITWGAGGIFTITPAG